MMDMFHCEKPMLGHAASALLLVDVLYIGILIGILLFHRKHRSLGVCCKTTNKHAGKRSVEQELYNLDYFALWSTMWKYVVQYMLFIYGSSRLEQHRGPYLCMHLEMLVYHLSKMWCSLTSAKWILVEYDLIGYHVFHF